MLPYCYRTGSYEESYFPEYEALRLTVSTVRIVGDKPRRTDDEVITVFDSTGVAIQDIAVAKLIFEKAKK